MSRHDPYSLGFVLEANPPSRSAPRCQRVLHLVLRLVLHRAPRFSEGTAFPFVKPIAEMGLR